MTHGFAPILPSSSLYWQVASETLTALRTVQSSNAQPYSAHLFGERVNGILSLARREALASGMFFGATGWSGNVTLLGLLGYGGFVRLYGICRLTGPQEAALCRRVSSQLEI